MHFLIPWGLPAPAALTIITSCIKSLQGCMRNFPFPSSTESFQLFSFPNLQTHRLVWKYATFCYLASHMLLLLFSLSFHKRKCNTMFDNFTSQPMPYEVFIIPVQNVLHCMAHHTFMTFMLLSSCRAQSSFPHKEGGGSKLCTHSVWKFLFVPATAALLNKGYHKTNILQRKNSWLSSFHYWATEIMQ